QRRNSRSVPCIPTCVAPFLCPPSCRTRLLSLVPLLIPFHTFSTRCIFRYIICCLQTVRWRPPLHFHSVSGELAFQPAKRIQPWLIYNDNVREYAGIQSHFDIQPGAVLPSAPI